MSSKPATRETAIVLFDGTCNLCDAAVRFIIANDPPGRFRFAPLQSATAARELARHAYAGPPGDSIIVIDADGVHARSDAALRIARGLRAPWSWLGSLGLIPQPVRDALYTVIARNRQRWFGRHTICAVPAGAHADRFLADDNP